ncbi:hypothetical protein N1851_024114 [Merluccius polli]|uniref:Uncharacterized protein n=1 Tax=Merluccius polli TaxID=89951 RepID=A0AA47MFT0_MERPO|nr:hypothetical protein N1851_024114 [Merluccius polli]
MADRSGPTADILFLPRCHWMGWIASSIKHPNRGRYCVLNDTVPVPPLYFDGGHDLSVDFRLSRGTFQSPMAYLATAHDHGWGPVIEALGFLFWLASGTSYRVVCRAFATPRSTVHMTAHRTSKKVVALLPQVIRLPAEGDLGRLGAGFSRSAGSAGCLTTSYRCALTAIYRGGDVLWRAFGFLKTRWRSIFLKALEVDVLYVPEVIACCAVLHICLSNGDLLEPEDRKDEPAEDNQHHRTLSVERRQDRGWRGSVLPQSMTMLSVEGPEGFPLVTTIDILYHRRRIGCCDAGTSAAILEWGRGAAGIDSWPYGSGYRRNQGCRTGAQRIPDQMSGPPKIGIRGLLFTRLRLPPEELKKARLWPLRIPPKCQPHTHKLRLTMRLRSVDAKPGLNKMMLDMLERRCQGDPSHAEQWHPNKSGCRDNTCDLPSPVEPSVTLCIIWLPRLSCAQLGLERRAVSITQRLESTAAS